MKVLDGTTVTHAVASVGYETTFGTRSATVTACGYKWNDVRVYDGEFGCLRCADALKDERKAWNEEHGR